MTPQPERPATSESNDGTRVQSEPPKTQDFSNDSTNPTFGSQLMDGGVPGYPFLSPPLAADEIGRLGEYRILKKLGEGGMGFVFRGEDPGLKRFIALKVMRPEVAKKPQSAERFLREGRAAAGLKSDHIITIYQVGQANGVPFLAMEFLEGLPLDEWIKAQKKPVQLPQALRVVRDALRGLATAHDKGLIHRDIKPANLWLEKGTARIKLLDFGLTRGNDADMQLTQEGAVVGTPAYMAPEQASGKPVDPRADLFSIGIVMYQLLAGKNPFARGNLMETLGAIGYETQPPIATVRPDVPKEYSDFLDRMLAKDANGRPAHAKAALQELTKIEKQLADGTKTLAPSAASMPMMAVPMMAVPMVAVPLPAAAPQVWGDLTEDDAPPARPVRAEAKGPPKPPSNKTLLYGGGLFAFLAVLGGIIIIITNKDGTKTKIELPDGAKVEVQDKGKTVAKASVGQPGLPPTYKNALGMEFVKVPKGTGWLGGVANKPGETKAEFADDFYLGKYEVTQGEWDDVLGANPCHFCRTGNGKDAVKDISDADLKRFPVEFVTWDECQIFVKKLNEKAKESGWVYRLPTQAEWEYACRGGPVDKSDSAFDFYFAKPTNALLAKQANFDNVLKRTCKVGSYEPNVLGLHDMHGNVHELCDDVLTNADGVSVRVSKGGYWDYNSGYLRAAHSNTFPLSNRSYNIGLRLARVRAAAAPANADADRKAAEWVFGLKGSVVIGGTRYYDAMKLPHGPLKVTAIYTGIAVVADADVERLRGLTDLVVVALSGITDAGLKALATLPAAAQFTEVNLAFNDLTDAGLAELTRFQKVTYFSLSGTKLTGAALGKLAALPQVEAITLWTGTPATDADVKSLVAAPRLRHVELNGAALTDAALVTLAEMKPLGVLMLTSDVKKITPSGVKAFQAARPNVKLGGDLLAVVDPDRAAAEWVLNRGGIVHLEGDKEMTSIPQLPKEPFQLTQVSIPKMAVEDGDLDRLRPLAKLTHLQLTGPITDAGLKKLATFPCAGQLLMLALIETNLTDDGLAALAQFPRLYQFSCQGSKDVTGTGFTKLKGKTEISQLILTHSGLSDAGLAAIKETWAELNILGIVGTAVTDTGIKHLGGMRLYGSLQLQYCPNVTDAGIRHLESLTELASLEYGFEPKLTGASLKSVGKMKSLKFLAAHVTYTDADLAPILDLDKLERLRLLSTPLTDVGLASLAKIKGLKELDVRGTKVTAAGVKAFKAALPECKVTSDFDK